MYYVGKSQSVTGNYPETASPTYTHASTASVTIKRNSDVCILCD